MPHVETEGASICWEAQGAGAPVLLIMGASFGKSMWYRTAAALSAQYRVITFDNRGVGGTVAAVEPFTIETLAADAAAVLDAAGVQSAHVYGVSMGGLIAQELALSEPDRVRSLILGCTGAPTASTVSISRFSRLKSRVPIRLATRLAAGHLYGPDTAKHKIREDRAVIDGTPVNKKLLALQHHAIALYESFHRVGAITAPTLVLHGTKDRIVAFELGRQLAELVPGARLVAFDGAGHNFVTDATAAANGAVLDFLDVVSAEARP